MVRFCHRVVAENFEPLAIVMPQYRVNEIGYRMNIEISRNVADA